MAGIRQPGTAGMRWLYADRCNMFIVDCGLVLLDGIS